MSMFFSSAAKLATKMEAMRSAEQALIEFARNFGNRSNDLNDNNNNDYEMNLFDTQIPSHVILSQQQQQQAATETETGGDIVSTSTSTSTSTLTIHGILVQNKNTNDKNMKRTQQQQQQHPTPLILLHGYANGGLYFYRNLIGLSKYFSSVYALDWLGWGLSSRPNFDQSIQDTTTESAEAFFVESLEAWRKAHKLPKMILVGHSMGGYMSVAYCEKYPQHVERLILLSPAGVPEITPELEERREAWRQRTIQSSWTGRTVMAILPSLFDSGYTPCSVLRTVPQSTGYGWVHGYVQRRLPAISNPDEQEAVAKYLYHNATLPGSAEYALNRVLRMDTMGRKPLMHRIPYLQIPQVTFLYGDNDWMDSKGGVETERLCNELSKSSSLTTSTSTSTSKPPQVDVYEVPKAGHLLMLDNWASVNAGIVIGGLGLHSHHQAKLILTREDLATVDMPKKLKPTTATAAAAAAAETTNNDVLSSSSLSTTSTNNATNMESTLQRRVSVQV